jgi:hypothetical protein
LLDPAALNVRGNVMRVGRILLSVGVASAIAGAAVPGVAGAKGVGPGKQRPARHAHRAAKKPHTEVWTLGEYVKGKVHKVPAGTSFYGRIAQTELLLSQKRENMNHFKWVERRFLYCGASAVRGKIKSNGVASPEIAIESIIGGLNREASCIEEAMHHPEEDIELFTPWMSAALKLTGLPMSLTLQPPRESQNEALLAPTSHFEFEVESDERTANCKYFYIPKINGQVSPGETHEAGQLSVRFAGRLSPETFTSQCPEEANFGFEIVSFAGEYGPALFASHK